MTEHHYEFQKDVYRRLRDGKVFVPIDTVLEIIDYVEHTEGLSKADEYGLLRMKIAELKGEQG